jgi:dCMP deaminase
MNIHDPKWMRRFLRVANTLAEWSKDRSRGVGCVIVGPKGDIRATGYNGFPRGVNDDISDRHNRPQKYLWTEHAERNAIYNAAREGVSLSGCTMFLPWFPCADCARGIIQSGISTLVCGQRPDMNDPKWGDGFSVVGEMLNEAGLTLIFCDDDT